MIRARVQPVAIGFVLALTLFGAASAWLGSADSSLFWAAATAFLSVCAAAAWRWPRGTLVGAALSTLLDPVVAHRILPESVRDGPIGISEPILAVAGLVLLVRVVVRRGIDVRWQPMEPTYWLAGLFVGIGILSALVNRVPPAVAGLGIVMTVDALAMFLAWRALRPSPSHAAWAIAAIVVAGVLVGLVGIGQIVIDAQFLGFPRSEHRSEIGRITSFLGNPNIASLVIGFCLPYPLYVVARPPSSTLRWLALVASFVLVLALMLTFSRGAWLAVGAGVVLGGILFEWRTIAVFASLVVVAAMLLPILPVADPVAVAPTPAPSTRALPSEPAESSAPTPRPTPRPAIRLGGKHRLNSEESRLYFVANGLEVIRDHPVLGVGPGRYGGAVAAILGSPVHEAYGTEFGNLRTVHNFWLHLLAEVGVAGTTVFVGMIAALMIRFARAARATSGPRFVVLGGSVTALLVIVVNNGFEMLFEGNIPAVMIWLILAIGSVLTPNPRLGLLPALRPNHP